MATALLVAFATAGALGLFASDPEGPSPTGSSSRGEGRSRTTISFVRYQTASGGDGFDVSARRDDVIVLQGFWRRDEIAVIREANPACKILIYQNISRTTVPDAQGHYNTAITTAEAEERGWASGIPDYQESWLQFVQPSDSSGYARFALERIEAKLAESTSAGFRVDGIFLDDDNSFAPEVRGGVQTSSAGEWNAWMRQVNAIVGPGLQERGYEVMANLSGAMAQRNLESGGWEEDQFQYFTYVFDQFVAYWPDGAPQPQRNIDEAFRLAGVARDAETVYVAAVPDGDVEARATFGLALLLIQSPEHAAKAPGRGDAEAWYPVYDRAKALGRPLEPPSSPRPGEWMRRFEGGSVQIDLNARTATIG